MHKGKQIKKIMRPILGLIATGAVALGCQSRMSNKTHYAQEYKKLIVNASPSEQCELNRVITDFATHSPSARKILDEILLCAPTISFFEEKPGEDRSVLGGSGGDDELLLNSNVEVREVEPLERTFFHEGEHVAHLKMAHALGINALSFASLDDVFCYNALIEALAERKSAICLAERELYPLNKEKEKHIKSIGEEAFLRALCGTNRDMVIQNAYVEQTMKMANGETNALPNQVYFKENPDWDNIVKRISRGEVTKVPILPVPTLQFMNVCLLREIEKHPDAKSLDDFDVSCSLSNRSILGKDEAAIKRMISDMLMEVVQGMVEKPTGKELSSEVTDAFVYWIGFPDDKQQEQIDNGKIDFDAVRDFNLAPLKTSEMFDAAENLIQSAEVQSFDTPETKTFGRILHFGKQIVLPAPKSRVYTQQKAR